MTQDTRSIESAAPPADAAFPAINRGYDTVFRAGRMSLGLVVPLEAYPKSRRPTLERHVERARLAERLGFRALWLRDVPFDVPSFGDAGQLHDPFVYLGYLAAHTTDIALGTASIVLPQRHPAHVAKAAASADVLSGGRLILDVASGDRPEEYPALGLPFDERGARFRESLTYVERVAEPRPAFTSPFGDLAGQVDLLPKPTAGRLPLLVTGGSQQAPDWLARHGDGWMIYPQPPALQARIVADWRARTAAAGGPAKPVLQSLYLDLADDPAEPPRRIHLGLRTGSDHLVEHLGAVGEAGVNHVALNLRFQRGDVEEAMQRLAADVLPHFHD